MNTCRTCVHWVEDGLPPVGHEDMKWCVCPKISEPTDLMNDTSTDLMVYSYDEGGGFHTGPDFGCVHHREVGK